MKHCRTITILILLFCICLVPLTNKGQTTQTPQSFVLGPQQPISASWFDQTQIARAKALGEACPAAPPADTDAQTITVGRETASYNNHFYYDLPLTLYIAHARTNDPALLTLARKCADSWWQHPSWIGQGKIRLWPDNVSPPPRHAGIGGLILRALDGRPEMWDWINQYTRFHFDVWLKKRIADPGLYYGLREGAFALHYAVWLAKALPDSFALQSGGTVTNGAALRAAYLADSEAIAVNYFGRLQFADGSWRWDDPDFIDPDGGKLKGITQPFMVGLTLAALIDLHILSTNQTVRANVANQITKSCRNLYEGGAYRKDEPVVGMTGKRWRSFWYFKYGGTTVNPTKYANGGGSYVDLSEGSWVVSGERQSIGTLFYAYYYVYLITGDVTFRDLGDELFNSAFSGEDGIRNLADGNGKNYSQNYRRGGSGMVWRNAGAAPTPSPSPIPSPVPSPSPSPTPVIREALDLLWPNDDAGQKALYQKLVSEGWADCVPTTSKNAGSKIRCWRVKQP